jgi:hypothetical protein
MKCQICNTHEASCKDYRFIEEYGLNGKVLACNWCRDLGDVAIIEIIDEGIDPKEYYEEEDENN